MEDVQELLVEVPEVRRFEVPEGPHGVVMCSLLASPPPFLASFGLQAASRTWQTYVFVY